MLLTAKNLLLNLLVVFAPLSIIQILYLLKHTNFLKKSSGWLLTLFPGISIILCMVYPVVVDDNFILDFRRIPFILGALYGGKWVAIVYLIITLTYRFALGGTGFYSTLLSFTLLTVAVSIASSKFLELKLKEKILVAAALDSMVGVISTIISLTFFETQIETSSWVLFNIASLLGVMLATLVYEVFINQFKLLQTVMEGQKLESRQPSCCKYFA